MNKLKVSIDKYLTAKSLAGLDTSNDNVAKFYINPFLAKKISEYCSLEIFRYIDEKSKQLSTDLNYTNEQKILNLESSTSIYLKNTAKAYSLWGIFGIFVGYIISVCSVFGFMNDSKSLELLSGLVIAFFFPGFILMIMAHSIFSKIYLNFSPTIKKIVDYAVYIQNDAKRQIDYWKMLSWREFEIEVASHLNKMGIEAYATPGSGDKGVDVVAQHKGKKIIIQCKKYAKPINPNFVRELVGTLVSEGVDYAFLVSFSGFSPGALSLRNSRVFLMDIDDFIHLEKITFEKLIENEI
jgi:HJR/Mrr/RecB family endonuclease